MKRLAEGLHMLSGFPPNAINVYLIGNPLVGNVLVDAGTRHSGRRIFRQLQGQHVSTHVLTHAHPDHQGASREVCERLNIELWCGEHDADAMESGDLGQKDHFINKVITRAWAGPAHPVARRLHEGDEVASFRVLDVPGHSPGHVAYWRESDRTLIAGDVLNNMNIMTGITGLHEPRLEFTTDPPLNRESARRLAALEPALVVFGHGPPLRDTRKFVEFVESLPR